MRHEAVYGFRHESRVVEVVTLRLRARGVTDKPTVAPAEHLRAEVPGAARLGTRPFVWRGRDMAAMWYDRERLLPGNRFAGPALVAEPSATIFVPPPRRGGGRCPGQPRHRPGRGVGASPCS